VKVLELAEIAALQALVGLHFLLELKMRSGSIARLISVLVSPVLASATRWADNRFCSSARRSRAADRLSGRVVGDVRALALGEPAGCHDLAGLRPRSSPRSAKSRPSRTP